MTASETCTLQREEDGAVVADALRLANTFSTRLRGLIGRRLEPRGGLWLEPCSSIHMMFVPYAIDVVFVRRAGEPLRPGAEGEVLKVCSHVRPWIGLAWCSGATSALELRAGRADELGLRAGDRLRLGPRSAA
ncbi:MAG: DUF192 domain-containing protein [Planctomycetes bacterium]|nr:DUF192 domain-containing protein [Planctomycetota bacterium]